MKFRKKPVVIEAWQFTEENRNNGSSWPEWLREAAELPIYTPGRVFYESGPVNMLVVNTLEGIMFARAGDWIIQGVNGELYPCKPDIFEETYDKVD
ncbi:MAG: hypothetical protein O7D91_17615 [Planctomycetota bacterium]|nr:hypothetical protein [Planctomycetota bacterium]